jgi:hypothetical protein
MPSVATNLAQKLPDPYFRFRGTAASVVPASRANLTQLVQAANAEKEYLPAKIEKQEKNR